MFFSLVQQAVHMHPMNWLKIWLKIIFFFFFLQFCPKNQITRIKITTLIFDKLKFMNMHIYCE